METKVGESGYKWHKVVDKLITLWIMEENDHGW